MSKVGLGRRDAFALLLGAIPAAAAAAENSRDLAWLMGADGALSVPPIGAPEAAQNAYVYTEAARALAVGQFPSVAMAPLFAFAGVRVGQIAISRRAVVVAYEMAPGSLLPPHNHPNYSVATIGVAGEAAVTQYELDGEAPAFESRAPFSVRRTIERVLRPGEAVTLIPDRDNVHTFRAGPNGARFIDVATPHGPDVGFSYMRIAEAAFSGSSDRFEAHWTSRRG
jgi:PCO_ADO